MPITMTREQYDALAALARKGATTEDTTRQLEAYLKTIELANGIQRNTLLVQWQEAKTPLTPTTNFPYTWPPELRATVTVEGRAVAKVDVESVLTSRASQPINVLVTPDPSGVVGWTKFEDYFV